MCSLVRGREIRYVRSVSFFFFFFLCVIDPVEITINAIDLASANNYGVYFFGDGKFVVGVGVGLLLQDLLTTR